MAAQSPFVRDEQLYDAMGNPIPGSAGMDYGDGSGNMTGELSPEQWAAVQSTAGNFARTAGNVGAELTGIPSLGRAVESGGDAYTSYQNGEYGDMAKHGANSAGNAIAGLLPTAAILRAIGGARAIGAAGASATLTTAAEAADGVQGAATRRSDAVSSNPQIVKMRKSLEDLDRTDPGLNDLIKQRDAQQQRLRDLDKPNGVRAGQAKQIREDAGGQVKTLTQQIETYRNSGPLAQAKEAARKALADEETRVGDEWQAQAPIRDRLPWAAPAAMVGFTALGTAIPAIGAVRKTAAGQTLKTKDYLTGGAIGGGMALEGKALPDEWDAAVYDTGTRARDQAIKNLTGMIDDPLHQSLPSFLGGSLMAVGGQKLINAARAPIQPTSAKDMARNAKRNAAEDKLRADGFDPEQRPAMPIRKLKAEDVPYEPVPIQRKQIPPFAADQPKTALSVRDETRTPGGGSQYQSGGQGFAQTPRNGDAPGDRARVATGEASNRTADTGAEATRSSPDGGLRGPPPLPPQGQARSPEEIMAAFGQPVPRGATGSDLVTSSSKPPFAKADQTQPYTRDPSQTMGRDLFEPKTSSGEFTRDPSQTMSKSLFDKAAGRHSAQDDLLSSIGDKLRHIDGMSPLNHALNVKGGPGRAQAIEEVRRRAGIPAGPMADETVGKVAKKTQGYLNRSGGDVEEAKKAIAADRGLGKITAAAAGATTAAATGSDTSEARAGLFGGRGHEAAGHSAEHAKARSALHQKLDTEGHPVISEAVQRIVDQNKIVSPHRLAAELRASHGDRFEGVKTNTREAAKILRRMGFTDED